MVPYPTHEFAGSNSERQSVGLPGHCERCAEVGHVRAHPNLGCGDVGCNRNHPPAGEAAYRWRGVNSHGGQVQGRMILTPAAVAAVVEDRYRQGWRSLSVYSGDGPVPPGGMADENNLVAAVEPNPDTGTRTWWAEVAPEAER